MHGAARIRALARGDIGLRHRGTVRYRVRLRYDIWLGWNRCWLLNRRLSRLIIGSDY